MTQHDRASASSSSLGASELHQLDAAQWRLITSQLHDPVTAQVVVTFLESHPQLLQRHAGTLLRARAVLARSHRQYEKGFRLGGLLGRVLRIFTQPLRRPVRTRRGAMRIEPSADHCQLVWPELIRD